MCDNTTYGIYKETKLPPKKPNGESIVKRYNVGTAWKRQNDEGFNLEICPEITVSGRLVILPARKPSRR